ncbi:VIT family protein [Paracoccus subflavus]|uniref:VIT family protein n=1 Tax=Paracoccus subflavus TaxID=2528244 RepID=A0A4Q9G856_9RHOB|nr:VIT family protein [Paracoccus subflavus]TBN43669.1 VIT family protein [Paracoccus subflavus]
MSVPRHDERHLVHRIGWLRAAVLGANDGLLSSASLIVGVAAAGSAKPAVLVAGLAGLVAGAMSMAAGEYVSVSSQADTEAADIARERRELADEPASELSELTAIYIKRGVHPDLAQAVAEQMTAKDALGSHLRDELGLSEIANAAPVQAALVSAATFAAGAAAPVAIAALAPAATIIVWVMAGTIVALAALGALGAAAGGASRFRGMVRVVFWGVLAMAITAGVGRVFGTITG